MSPPSEKQNNVWRITVKRTNDQAKTDHGGFNTGQKLYLREYRDIVHPVWSGLTGIGSAENTVWIK